MKKGLFLYFLFICSCQMFAQRPTWSVNETIFESTQTMIAKLSLDGKLLENPNDMVGAFVGNECRGVASPVFIPATGKYYTFLTVFSNKQKEEITFKLYEHSSGRIVPVDKKLNFNINGHIGSYFQAYSIAMPTLSNQAAISSFELYNVKPDSVVTRGDVRVYYVPFSVSRDSIRTNFSVSPGTKVFVKEVPVVSQVTKINFTNQVIFQVVSPDDSTLLEYKVSVINSPFSECSSVNIPKPTVTLDASYNLMSSAVSGNQWYKEGIIINGAVSSIFKPASNGTYSVKVTNAAGCTSDMSPNFNFLITAVSSLAKEEFVTFSPNPVVDELRIQYYLINTLKAYISILDMNGRPVVDGKEMASDTTVSLRELPIGIYVLNLLDSEGRILYTQKIIKI